MQVKDFEFISWEKLYHLCFLLKERISKKKPNFDKIVAISRGGLVVARILSDLLNLPISNFTIVAYKEIGKMESPRVVEGLASSVAGQRLLLVDEIVDSGKTLFRGRAYLKNFGPKLILSAVPIVKSRANPKPDFFVKITEKWVIFPYEVCETTEDILRKMKLEKASNKDIATFLINVGLPATLVEATLKERMRKD